MLARSGSVVSGNAQSLHSATAREKRISSFREDEEDLRPARQGWRSRSRQANARRDVVPSLISEYWIMMTFLVSLSFALAALLSWSMPPAQTSKLIVSALLVIALVPFIRRFEARKERHIAVRVGVMLLAVALPMFLYGYAVAAWTETGGLSWKLALGTLILCTALAAVIQNGKAPGLFAAQIGCWGAVALVDGSILTLGLFAGAVLFAVLVSRWQLQVVKADRKRARERDRIRDRAEDILNDYEDTGLGWFWETDRHGALTYVSHTVANAIGGLRTEDMLGRPFTSLFDLSASGQEGERTLIFHLSARSSFHELVIRAAVKDETRWWSVSGRPLYDDFGNFVGFRGSGTDLTEKKRSQEKASRLALYDSLTGLANRFQMAQSLEKILDAPVEMHRSCAVLLIDLDRFKQVNDTLGHPAGDSLLNLVAERIEKTVGDNGRVGRLGGDEFKVLLPGEIRRERLASIAAGIIVALSQPYAIDGHRVVIGASIGISISPDDGVTSEALIRNADLALYAAKDGGRGRYHFYAEDLHSQAEERRQLEQDLRDAIGSGGLEMHYQPVVDTATEKISGFEALMRWTHPEKGPMAPEKFIAIAEDAGLIGTLGEWALRTACHDLAKWPDEVRVAVNVSPLQFANPQLPAIITSAIAEAGIEASRLELEITESVFLNDDDGTDAMFDALKRVGVRLALDDFGTGYSSLGYLKKAPFDKIKIDQSFVRGATEPGSRNGAIIASITSLAQALGMETTAEGVETLDELDLVRLQGCSHVQGYIYAQPMSRDAATVRLGSGLAAIAKGPRSARQPRQTVLRRVVIEKDGQFQNATIRNMSASGALIEGPWHIPAGTKFRLGLSEEEAVTVVARWSEENRTGVEFVSPVEHRDSAQSANPPAFRKAG